MIKTFFLVLTFSGGITTIPKPYPNEQLCLDAMNSYKDNFGKYAYCVPHWSDPSVK